MVVPFGSSVVSTVPSLSANSGIYFLRTMVPASACYHIGKNVQMTSPRTLVTGGTGRVGIGGRRALARRRAGRRGRRAPRRRPVDRGGRPGPRVRAGRGARRPRVARPRRRRRVRAEAGGRGDGGGLGRRVRRHRRRGGSSSPRRRRRTCARARGPWSSSRTSRPTEPWPSFAPHCAAKAAQAMLDPRARARAGARGARLRPRARPGRGRARPGGAPSGGDCARPHRHARRRRRRRSSTWPARGSLPGRPWSSTAVACCNPGPRTLRNRRRWSSSWTGQRSVLRHAARNASIERRRDAEPTDGELIEQVGDGDRDAFDALYGRYTRPIFGLALRRLGNREQAEDASRTRSRRSGARPRATTASRGPGGAWLYTVARNAIVDACASAARRRRSRRRSPPPRRPARAGRGGWLAWRVHRRSASCPSERPVLELAYWGGLSQSEIAEFLNIPLGTVKTRTRSGLSRLADLLEEELG